MKVLIIEDQARLGEQAAGGESGLPGSNDKSVSKLHGGTNRKPDAAARPPVEVASDQPVTTSTDTGTPPVITS